MMQYFCIALFLFVKKPKMCIDGQRIAFAYAYAICFPSVPRVVRRLRSLLSLPDGEQADQINALLFKDAQK